MAYYFIAGVARALLFKGQELVGVAKTLIDSAIDFTVSAEEIRAGAGNVLWGKYFHTSNMEVTLTDAMFNLQYFASSLGTAVNMGGISVAEEQYTVTTAGSITLNSDPVAFDGDIIVWYKKPADNDWVVGTVTGKVLTIAGAQVGDIYCVKYMYQDANAQNIVLKAQYIPDTLHVVLLTDLFYGDVADASGASKAGRVIIDIPRLQMAGSQNMSLTSTGAATTSLTGSALASSPEGCEDDPYYGTITQQIFNAKWQDSVRALAIENGEVELLNGATETLSVYAVFNGGIAPKKLNNADLTFSMVGGTTVATVGANTGVITTVAAGNATVKVVLTGYPSVDAAYAYVTVT